MRFFRDLGLAILDSWQRADFDARSFPEIAAIALRERDPSAHVDPMDVVRWVHETAELAAQADLDARFGQPPITVWSCEQFYIDVLFWVDGTTTIHEHRFSGAFQVMAGQSVQSTYRFAPARRYCDQLVSGELELVDIELLTKGEVRPIHPGSELIHALFHLDRPSVSVVVRTVSDVFAGPQYEYLQAGIAVDPFGKSASTTRKIQTIDLLCDLSHPELEPIARAAVRRADSFLAFSLLRHLMKRIEPHEKYLTFLDSIRPAHESLIDVLKLHAHEHRREKHILWCRQRAKHPGHRFLLALLLTVRDRSRLLDLVRRAFPEERPAGTIARWLAEIAKIDEINAWVDGLSKGGLEGGAGRILDVHVDQASMRIVEHILEGVADDAVAGRLNEPSVSGGTGVPSVDVSAVCAALRASAILRPLFAHK